MPLLGVVGYAALVMADSRYMEDEDGVAIEAKVAQVQKSVQEVQREQDASEIRQQAMAGDLNEVKQDTKEINDKLDRLIERELSR